MSYNILAISSKEIDWNNLHESVVKYNNSLEYTPILASKIIKKDSLGISIPSSKINNYTWNEIENVFNILISNYKMKIYDLYSGQEITKKNFNIVKSNLFG